MNARSRVVTSRTRGFLKGLAVGLLLTALPFLRPLKPRAAAILFDGGTVIVMVCMVLLFMELRERS